MIIPALTPSYRSQHLKHLLSLLTCLTLALCCVSCGNNNSNGPGPSAWRFAQALAGKDFSRAAAETTKPTQALKDLTTAFQGLNSSKVEVKIGQVHTKGAASQVAYHYSWTLFDSQIFQYAGTFEYISQNGIWRMRWSEQAIHPQLGSGQNLIMTKIVPEASSLNSHHGGAIMIPSIDERLRFDAHTAGDPDTARAVAQQLVSLFATHNRSLSTESILNQSAYQGPVTIIEMPEEKFNKYHHIRAILSLPGVSIQHLQAWKLVNPNYKGFLEPILNALIAHNQTGTTGWQVDSVDDSGNIVQILNSHEVTPNPALTITLEDRIQHAAQHAVDTREDKPVALVAIQPSTGNIVALAENKPAQHLGPILLNGLYPPGSTFKIITAAASLENNLATENTQVPCPGKITIAHRIIPNFNGFSLGPVSMRTAFAQSCNTSFAWLASKLKPTDLHNTALQYGLGDDYLIPGLTTVTGKIPTNPNIIERTEAGFGQGKDLASPLGIALIAATVAHGKKVIPQFVIHQPTTQTSTNPETTTSFSPKDTTAIRSMMRAVVTQGTGRDLAGLGKVYGKTGEAEYNGGSHAWFTGYRDDLAFAVLVVSGQSSLHATNVSRYFLQSL